MNNNKNLSFINKLQQYPLSLSFVLFVLYRGFLLSLYISFCCLSVCLLKGFIWFYVRCTFVFCFFLLFFAVGWGY